MDTAMKTSAPTEDKLNIFTFHLPALLVAQATQCRKLGLQKNTAVERSNVIMQV
jgi:hypothetical protein